MNYDTRTRLENSAPYDVIANARLIADKLLAPAQRVAEPLFGSVAQAAGRAALYTVAIFRSYDGADRR
jgi:hypothetical protein